MRGVQGLLIGYGVIAFFAAWPIVSVASAGVIATLNGCTLHEGFVNPCVVNGRDIGETLYSMGVHGMVHARHDPDGRGGLRGMDDRVGHLVPPPASDERLICIPAHPFLERR